MTRYTITITDDLAWQIETAARESGREAEDVIAQAVTEYVAGVQVVPQLEALIEKVRLAVAPIAEKTLTGHVPDMSLK